MLVVNATDVRKEWGSFIDSIVREKPKVIKRSRDYIFTASVDMLKEILKPYTFTAEIYKEDDGTVTVSLNEIDLVENASCEEEAVEKLANALVEYAKDYYNDFQYWFSAPNRKSHLPFVLHVLLQDSIEGVKGLIRCQHGKN
ncbi:MAG: hypothetical protein PWR01_1371 [Clostridiales bacterium]|jgi:hypothetical protein|nr:hypothetical protein [Clostridiales bacterium]